MEGLSHTCDLGFAAALITLGHRIHEELTDEQDGKKLFGFYITKSTMRRLHIQYRAGEMQVDAQTNASSIKHVKKMLYQNRTLSE